MSIKEIKNKAVILRYNEETLQIEVENHGNLWQWDEVYKPYFKIGEEIIYFQDAGAIEHFSWHTGVGEGFRTKFSRFVINGSESPLSFETLVWVEDATQNVYFELIPVEEAHELMGNFYWPGQMAFKENSSKWYTVINMLQGLMIPNNWPHQVDRLVFDGQMCSSAAYMPWFGQVRNTDGYIAIVCTHHGMQAIKLTIQQNLTFVILQ